MKLRKVLNRRDQIDQIMLWLVKMLEVIEARKLRQVKKRLRAMKKTLQNRGISVAPTTLNLGETVMKVLVRPWCTAKTITQQSIAIWTT